MYQPSRTRRMLKWAGVGLCTLVFTAWGLSTGFGFFTPLGRTYAIAVTSGVIAVGASPRPYALVARPHWDRVPRGFGFHWPHFENWNSSRDFTFVIPLWLVLILTAIPTAWLWHRDRRRILPGCCLRCGYNLTGNTSGVCSECGEQISSPIQAGVKL